MGVVGHTWYLHAATYCIVVTTATYALGTALSGAGLCSDLRSTIYSPLLRFTLISFASFSALVIAGYVLIKWPAQVTLRPKSLITEAEHIVVLTHLRVLYNARRTGVAEVLVGVAGIALWGLVISQLKNPLRFRRDDDNRMTIGVGLLLAGDRRRAEGWLKPVLTRGTGRKEGDTALAQALLDLSAGDFDGAIQAADVWRAGRTLAMSAPKDEDEPRWALAQAGAPFLERGAVELYSDLVTYLVRSDVSDPCLAGIVSLMLPEHRDVAKSLVAAAGAERYPLTGSLLAMADDDLDRASAHLKLARRRGVPHRVMKRMLSFNVELASASRGGAEAFWDAAQTHVRKLLAETADWSVDTLPLWLREWLAVDAYGWEIMSCTARGPAALTADLGRLREVLLPGVDPSASEGGMRRPLFSGSSGSESRGEWRGDFGLQDGLGLAYLVGRFVLVAVVGYLVGSAAQVGLMALGLGTHPSGIIGGMVWGYIVLTRRSW